MKTQSSIDKNDVCQIFDYRTEELLEIDTEFDRLDPEQKRWLNDAMKQIKQETRQKAEERSVNWIKDMVMPVLKAYARRNCSRLEIEMQDDSLMIAELKNIYGFDLLDSNQAMKAVLGLAGHIEVKAEQDQIVLSMVFDCSKMEIYG